MKYGPKTFKTTAMDVLNLCSCMELCSIKIKAKLRNNAQMQRDSKAYFSADRKCPQELAEEAQV